MASILFSIFMRFLVVKTKTGTPITLPDMLLSGITSISKIEQLNFGSTSHDDTKATLGSLAIIL
jgi:hypothetical protein